MENSDSNNSGALSSSWSGLACSPPEAKKSKPSDDSNAAAIAAVIVISSTADIAEINNASSGPLQISISASPEASLVGQQLGLGSSVGGVGIGAASVNFNTDEKLLRQIADQIGATISNHAALEV